VVGGKVIKQEITEICEPSVVSNDSAQEQDAKLTPNKNEPPPTRRQQRSRLPSSLKDRIVRSSARTKALSTEIAPLQIKPQSRLPIAVCFPKKQAPVVIKAEVDEQVGATVSDSSKSPLIDDAFSTVKQENEKIEVPPRSEKPCVPGRLAARNSICGKKRVFTHPRLNKGQRIVQLIESTVTTSLSKRQVHVTRKSRKAPSDTNVADSSQKTVASVRKARVRSKKVAEEEKITNRQHDQDSNQILKSEADVCTLEAIMSNMDWEKPVKQAKRGRRAKQEKSTPMSEQPQRVGGKKKSIPDSGRKRRQKTPTMQPETNVPPEAHGFSDKELRSNTGNEREVCDERDAEEVTERLSRASRRKLTLVLLITYLQGLCLNICNSDSTWS
ncbi:hypothetical protein GCK32_004913, partial [Trichostrongylus colubriformis]